MKPCHNDMSKNFFCFVLILEVVQCHFLYMHATEPFKFANSCAHSEHERICVVIINECLHPGILNKYIFFRSP